MFEFVAVVSKTREIYFSNGASSAEDGRSNKTLSRTRKKGQFLHSALSAQLPCTGLRTVLDAEFPALLLTLDKKLPVFIEGLSFL